MVGKWKRVEAGHYEHPSGASVWRTVRHVNSDRACNGYTFASSRRKRKRKPKALRKAGRIRHLTKAEGNGVAGWRVVESA